VLISVVGGFLGTPMVCTLLYRRPGMDVTTRPVVSNHEGEYAFPCMVVSEFVFEPAQQAEVQDVCSYTNISIAMWSTRYAADCGLIPSKVK
jgi:hypothetical protein